MLVGGAPTRCPHQVRRKLFCTTYFFFENQSMVDFQIRNRWYKKFCAGPGRGTWSGHLVGAPGRGTWWGHLVGAPPTNMSPPAPARDPPGYPPHRPGT